MSSIDRADSSMTDALVKHHEEETTALLRKLHTPEDMRQHAVRQAKELLDHAYDMERRLHEMWLDYRWTGKS